VRVELKLGDQTMQWARSTQRIQILKELHPLFIAKISTK